MKAAQKVSVTETSGATFTSYAPYETTADQLTMTDEEFDTLMSTGLVVLISYNRVGTRTKRVVKKI